MFQRIIHYFTSSFEEAKKVIWPNRQIVISHTVIVVVAIAISMGVVALLDFGLFNLLQLLIYQK